MTPFAALQRWLDRRLDAAGGAWLREAVAGVAAASTDRELFRCVSLVSRKLGKAPLALDGAIGSVVGAYYYLKIVKIMYFDEAKAPYESMAPGLRIVLGLSSVVKSRFLARLLGAPVSGWRWALVWAATAAAS